MFSHISDKYTYGLTEHVSTKNISFLKQSAILQAKGIKNCKFMLYLKHKELMNIDPLKLEDPSPELAQMIGLECKINPWYFFREVVRVPAQGGEPKRFILHRGNMALIWLFYQNIDTYTMLPRQHFKTVSTMSIAAQVMYVRTINYPMVLFTKDSGLIQDNVSRLKQIRDSLPPYLLFKSPKDKDNDEGLSYTYLGNTYKTIPGQNDPFSADRRAKGGSMAFQHWDEIDFIPYLQVMYPAAVSATNEAILNAEAVGAPHAQILTSTAGYLNKPEGAFAQSIRDQCMVFKDNLYDAGDTPTLKSILKQNSINQMFLIIYNFLQLGHSFEWLRQTVARENADHDKIMRDYYLIPTSGSGENGIPSKYLETLRENQKDPLHTDLTEEHYQFNWYITREYRESSVFKNKTFILGMDSSTATGSDYITLCLLDPSDMSVIATMKTNETNTHRIAMLIAKLIIDTKTMKFIWVPENKSTGTNIIDTVLMIISKYNSEHSPSERINPFKRIYNDVVQNLNDKQYQNINIAIEDPTDSSLRKKFGYVTAGSGGNSRETLFSKTLYRTLEQNAARCYDADIVNEFCGLQFKNGRLDHSNSGHDDLVVAYLLACYMVYFGKNLSIYGLTSKDLMSRIDPKGNPIDMAVKNENDRIINRVLELDTLIRNTTNTLIKASLQRELKTLQFYIEENNLKQPSELTSSPETFEGMSTKKKLDVDGLQQWMTKVNNVRYGMNNTVGSSYPYYQ